MNFNKTTESDSLYEHLEEMEIQQLLKNINQEDKSVPDAVEKALPQIEKLVTEASKKVAAGGRLFYIGAGTSGRLGILDASECPPTFGVAYDKVIGIIAGGDKAIRKAVEFAEDSTIQGWEDLRAYNINAEDFVIGIAASGTTPYVLGAMENCNINNILTGCITCNLNSPLALISKYPIEVITGPEFVTGSSRMKAGTAQKLVLNMISTTIMIRLGRVKGNKMVDMQLSNEKLFERGIQMLMLELQINRETATSLINHHKNVRQAIKAYKNETHK